MMRRSVISFLILAAVAATVDAQVYRRPFAYGRAGWWWGGVQPGYTGSTPAESYARGQAELLRARGQAYEAAARGAIDYEQARASYLENQKRWHEISLERQKMGQQQREEHYAAQRAARERRQLSTPDTPRPTLSDSQYDRGTGAVTWPEVLLLDSFAGERTELEELLKLKAHTGSTGDVDDRIYQTAEEMMGNLKQQVRTLPPTAYIEARKFLDLLMDEIGPPIG